MKMLNKMLMLILNIRCWCNLPISAGSLIDLLVVGISSEWREVEFSEKHLQNLKKILLNKILIHKIKKKEWMEMRWKYLAFLFFAQTDIQDPMETAFYPENFKKYM